MNLQKITASLLLYTSALPQEVPNVLELYKVLGEKYIGRKIYEYPTQGAMYFNKSKIHKKEKHYIGEASDLFYAQDIVKIRNEARFLCVKGNANGYQEIADLIISKFGINDFVFDIWVNEEGKEFIMELNEMQLSTINEKEFAFILQNLI